MDPLKVLRQKAADKRDAAIRAARREFKHSLRLIDELSRSFPAAEPIARKRGTGQAIIDLILKVMPQDKSFTVRDIIALLRQTYPSKRFNEPTVRTLFTRLLDQGAVRKLRKTDKGFVLFAAIGSSIESDPLMAVSIADITAQMLHEHGPLKSAEIVVRLQAMGYRSDAAPRVLLRCLTQAFQRNKDRFASDGDGVWRSV